MATQPPQQSAVAFGPFKFNEVSGQLTKHGTVLRLQGKTLQILSVLLSRSGEIVSRDELQKLLWGATPFGDFEQGLNSAINKLRQILGDSASQPRYIETISGEGYRFVAPLRHGGTSSLPDLPPAAAPAAEVPQQRAVRVRTVVMVSAAFLVIAVLLFGIAKRPTPLPHVAEAVTFSVLPPPGFALEGAASRQAFAISPDGKRLAFTALGASGEFQLFLRDWQTLEPYAVLGGEGIHTVFWSPDATGLYLTARGKLLRIPLEGHSPMLLGASPSFMFSGTFINARQMFLDSFRATYIASPSGGPFKPLQKTYLWPTVLPGGEHAIYVRWDSRAGCYRAYLLRTRDLSTIRDLMETDSRVIYTPSALTSGTGYLLYIRGGTLLARSFNPTAMEFIGDAKSIAGNVGYFAKTAAGDFAVAGGVLAYQRNASRSQLVWVDRSGHELATIGPPNINVKSGRLSPDGRTLATAIFDTERGHQDLWSFDIRTNSGRKLSGTPALRDAPVWSPDSSRLAFLSQADGDPPKVYLRGVTGSGVEEIAEGDGFQLPTDWSPDGRFVAFVNTGFPRTANETQSDVWLMDLARGRKCIPLLATPFHEANATFSPDGQWLAFTSNESGSPELYVQKFRSGNDPAVLGERLLASRAGALAVRWRRDGKELFYLGFDGTVFAVTVSPSDRLAFGPPVPLFTVSTEARAAIHSVMGFDVSSDGKRFVIVRASTAPSITITKNWETLFTGALRPRDR